MTEINPCPICKGKIELFEYPMFGGDTYYKFWCTECHMDFSKLEWANGYGKSKIIEEWNRGAKE